tara:strand:+ start:3587 stop:4435 length:849 start_codon:yes stop_codon:yes gene_type:complete
MVNYLPLSFIIFWSSAFISGQFIVQSASPFAALTFRFIIVAICFLVFSFFFKEKILINLKLIIQASITGILFHGFYLGGVFFSYSVGLSATLSALIVGLQPILTNILSGPILNERVTMIQWLGILLGLIGTVMVIGYEIGESIPLLGLISSIVALLGATIATIWQKKITSDITLSVNNFYQAFAASIFLIIILILFENPFINFDSRFILSMGWQIIMVSFGAYAILMYLIKKGTASRTSNLFFLVPPVTAIMAWFVLDEKLLLIDIMGLLICAFGVYIATRK